MLYIYTISRVGILFLFIYFFYFWFLVAVQRRGYDNRYFPSEHAPAKKYVRFKKAATLHHDAQNINNYNYILYYFVIVVNNFSEGSLTIQMSCYSYLKLTHANAKSII